MNAEKSFDAIVIGGGINGFTAAAFLAKARRRTLLVEARHTLGGLCEGQSFANRFRTVIGAHSLYALDPSVFVGLGLARRGLKFALRDAPISLLCQSAGNITLSRDVRASARSIATHSKADAETWPEYRRELFAFGRAMRPWWWEPAGTLPAHNMLGAVVHSGSGAWLSSRFESDALRSLLLFDAAETSPLEPGSALLLAWRAAQEVCGLQGAVSVPSGGPAAVIAAIADSCTSAGVEILGGARVHEMIVEKDRIHGVRLETGEVVKAPIVLSSLPRRTTLLRLAHGAALSLAEQRDLEQAKPVTGTAIVNLALASLPPSNLDFDTMKGQLIVAERPESYVSAHADSRAGRIPGDLTMQVTFPSLLESGWAPEGKHVVRVLIRPVPRRPIDGWDAAKPLLAAKVVSVLQRHFRGLASLVVGVDVFTPDDLAVRYASEEEGTSFSRMLAPWTARTCTPIEGLFLCGAGADPVAAVSGRAGRIAALLSLKPSGS